MSTGQMHGPASFISRAICGTRKAQASLAQAIAAVKGAGRIALTFPPFVSALPRRIPALAGKDVNILFANETAKRCIRSKISPMW